MNSPLTNRSLLDTLRAIDNTEDKDIAFIFAAAINLYIESIRRVKGRVLLGVDDIPVLMDVIAALTTQTPDIRTFIDKSIRTRELTTEEADKLMNAMSDVMPGAKP